MTNHNRLITELRNQAAVIGGGTEADMLAEAADVIEEQDERIAIITEDDQTERLKQLEGVPCCATCKWLSDTFSCICVNDASDQCADFVHLSDRCGYWEAET